jgi:hypothetical protein
VTNQALGMVGAITFGHWILWGNVTTIDLIAAATNALNGALLARRPDHFRNFTIVGILLMALLGGLGGGITRDILAGSIPPGALINPAYITLCLVCGVVGYRLAYAEGQLFREGLFQFMTSFSLPWYAIAGVQKGVAVHLPVVGALFLAVVARPLAATTSTSPAACRPSSSYGGSGSSELRCSPAWCGWWRMQQGPMPDSPRVLPLSSGTPSG